MSSLDWHALGEVDNSPVHYRKWKVYDLEEPIPVGEYQLSGAPYGGSVAAVSEPSQPSAPGGIVEPMELKIYTSSGMKGNITSSHIMYHIYYIIFTLCCVFF
jgi:hypothetical protein